MGKTLKDKSAWCDKVSTQQRCQNNYNFLVTKNKLEQNGITILGLDLEVEAKPGRGPLAGNTISGPLGVGPLTPGYHSPGEMRLQQPASLVRTQRDQRK